MTADQPDTLTARIAQALTDDVLQAAFRDDIVYAADHRQHVLDALDRAGITSLLAESERAHAEAIQRLETELADVRELARVKIGTAEHERDVALDARDEQDAEIQRLRADREALDRIQRQNALIAGEWSTRALRAEAERDALAARVQTMEKERDKARLTAKRLNRRNSLLEGAVHQMWDACKSDSVRLFRRHDRAHQIVREMERALAQADAPAGEPR